MVESVQVDWKGLRGQALIQHQHTTRNSTRNVYSPRPSILLMILSRYPHDQKCLRPRPRRGIFIRGHARSSNCQKVAGQVALALTRSFVLCCVGNICMASSSSSIKSPSKAFWSLNGHQNDNHINNSNNNNNRRKETKLPAQQTQHTRPRINRERIISWRRWEPRGTNSVYLWRIINE